MLRACVVMDYQNVHLTARDVFVARQPEWQALIHPMNFARCAVARRNANQREGYEHCQLERVEVFRGLPSSEHDPYQHGACTAQADQWRRDGADVVLRDLKYRYDRQADGSARRDVNGKKVVQGRPREKGIDVLVALACVRAALDPAIDLVMLASRDTDLVPALDEVYDMGIQRGARIETLTWDDPAEGRRFGSLRPSRPRKIWNTNLGRREFEASLDRRDYR